jgi:hypothetical protein
MLAVIAVGSVLLGIASGLLVLLMSVEENSRDSLRQQVMLSELAGQFRRDVRRCARVAEGDSPIFVGRKLGQSPAPAEAKPQGLSAWRLQMPEGTVVQYRVHGTSLIRVLSEGGVVREQEAYQLPEKSQVSLELSAAGGPAIVSLLITSPQGKPLRSVLHAVQIDAGLDADRMLLNGTRDEMTQVRSTGFSRQSAEVRSTGFSRQSATTPPKGGTTNVAFSTALSVAPGGHAGLVHVEVSP